MSDDLDERLKRAAQEHAAKSEANGRAKEDQRKDRVAFLAKFYDLSRNVIEPELEGAKATIEASCKVTARISRSDDENEITLTLTDADRRRISVLVFVADPLRMRVRVHSSALKDWGDSDAVSKFSGASAADTPAHAALSLAEVTRANMKLFATDFGVRSLS